MKALCFVRLKVYKDLTSFNHEGPLLSSVVADSLGVSSFITREVKNPGGFREKPCIVTVFTLSGKLRSHFCIDTLCTQVIKLKLYEYYTALFPHSGVI
jgi:hypothetical protein